MKCLKALLVTIILMSSMALVHANDSGEAIGFNKADWFVSAGITYYSDFGESAADEGIGPGLTVGYWISDRWALEFAYTRYEFENNTQLTFSNYADSYMFNGLYKFKQTEAYQAFAVFGVSTIDEINSSEYKEFRDEQLNAGIGISYALPANLLLRGDIRANYSLEFSEIQPLVFIGLSYKFD